MGQFDGYIDRRAEPPPWLMRAFCLLVPGVMAVRAVGSHRLEDIVTAVFFVVMFLPSGIAPNAHRARLAALDKHLVLGVIFAFVVTLSGAFVLLAMFLDRSTSIYIAVPAAFVLTAVAGVRQQARIRAAAEVDRT